MQTRRRSAARCVEIVQEAVVLGRPGNDLLSRVLRHSTIGAEEFNGRVRDGIGFFSSSLKSPDRRRTNSRQGRLKPPPGTSQLQGQNFILPPATLPDRKVRKPERASALVRRVFLITIMITDSDHESNQANRAISTSQLNASPRLHTWPINVVVFHGSDRENSFRGGFPA